ncbi:MAG: SH3 domain-containing protein, partial [Candidatus Muiribacteriota bacterium]
SILLIFLLIFTFSVFSVDSETLNNKLEILKEQAAILTREQNTLNRSRMAREEMDEEEDPLYELLWYIHKMNSEHPDVLDDERKDYLNILLNQMGRALMTRGDISNESVRQNLYIQLSEILETIVEDILVVDESHIGEFERQTGIQVRNPQPEEDDGREYYKGRITGNAVNVRSGPGTYFDVLVTLNLGTDVVILNKDNDWYQVKMPDGRLGFIFHTLLRELDEEADGIYQSFTTGTVKVTVANVRSGPGDNFTKIDALKYGTVIKIYDSSSNWYEIQTPDGLFGFIFGQLVFLDDSDAEMIGQGRIKVHSANVRMGPGTNHLVIATLSSGTMFNVVEKQGNWYKIRMNDGQTGFIYYNLIQIIENPDNDTIVTPQPPQNPDVPEQPDEPAQPVTERGKIIVNSANIRKGAGTNFGILTTLKRNTTFEILSKTSSWFRIKLDDGRIGFVYETLIERIQGGIGSTPDIEYATIDVNAANVRSGPGTSYSIVATLNHGTDVKVLERNTWSKIEAPDGTVGYCHSNLLSFASDGFSEPSEKAERIAYYANQAVGQSGVIFGVSCYTKDTAYGRLACAAVVSAILKKSNVGYNKVELYCPYQQRYLDSIGFKTITNKRYNKGDVVFWAKYQGDRARHVGVIVQKDVYGNWWTVDNSSSQLKVLKRPLIRSYYPVVLPVKRVQ